MAERLFAAYFTESLRISDPDVLLRLGVEIGLDADEITALLEGDAFAEDVRADEAMAAESGFTGVPTFVIDGQFAIPGAQPAETLVRLLGRLATSDTTDFVQPEG